MSEDGREAPAPRKWRRTRAGVGWSAALGEAICRRVAAGELLYVICREAGMPTPQSVGRWARERAGFGAALAEARLAGGRTAKGGGVSSYDRGLAQVICQRIAEGEALTAICQEVEMPCFSTLYAWGRKIPEFADMMRAAREAQAHWYCDTGWTLAMQATPDTAYVTDVRLKQLRWTAGCLAPRVYGVKRVEPEAAQEVLTTLIRTFGIKTHPLTGERKVVAYTPNPETMQVECDDDAKGTAAWIEEPPGPPHPGTPWKKIVEEW